MSAWRVALSPWRGAAGCAGGWLTELTRYVAVVAVAEAELDGVADVHLVRAVAAVDQAGFLERGFCAGPAGLCPEIGVDGALPGGERRQQDPGLVFTEGGSPVVSRRARRCASVRTSRRGVTVPVSGGTRRSASGPPRSGSSWAAATVATARQLPSQGAGELVRGERGPGGGGHGEHGEGIGPPVLAVSPTAQGPSEPSEAAGVLPGGRS
jgi:hypothetical protein